MLALVVAVGFLAGITEQVLRVLYRGEFAVPIVALSSPPHAVGTLVHTLLFITLTSKPDLALCHEC